MTYDERRTTIARDTPDPAVYPVRSAARTEVVDESRSVSTRPRGSTVVARVVAILFGIVQILIGLRIVLLAIDARQGNAIVSGILNLSQPLVAPFEGILRTNALQSGGAVLDLAAVVALVGWTILELVVLALLRVGRAGDDV